MAHAEPAPFLARFAAGAPSWGAAWRFSCLLPAVLEAAAAFGDMFANQAANEGYGTSVPKGAYD